MPNSPQISNAEWEVMQVLWEAEQALGLSEIIERLPANQSRNPKTINTYLSRLTAKGAVQVRKVGRTNLYSAIAKQEDCLRDECQNFVKRVFRGATAPMMATLIEDADLSKADIQQLQKLLDQKKEADKS